MYKDKETMPPTDEIISNLYENGILGEHDTEWKFYNSIYNISGMIDGAFLFNSRQTMWEFKTMNPTEFQSLAEPKKAHLEQGAVYNLALGIPHILFHYENKGTHEYKVFEYEYKEVHREWVIAKIERVNNYVAQKILPPKCSETMECRYCEYKSYCERNEK
jgi:hypothetical protein